MSEKLNKILSANAKYSENDPGLKDLTAFPKNEVVLLTCMDVRLDPLSFAGFEVGDANILRNAGGRASDDAIRSLIVASKLLGAKEFFVIMHTHCGMESIDNETMGFLLSESLEKAEFDGHKWNNVVTGNGSDEGKKIDWMTINNLEETLISDVHKIRNHPLIHDSVEISGLIFDVKTGKLKNIIEL